MLRHENYTLVYRNLVVLLNVCEAPQNLKKMKQLNVVLLEPLLVLCEVLCARPCLSALWFASILTRAHQSSVCDWATASEIVIWCHIFLNPAVSFTEPIYKGDH